VSSFVFFDADRSQLHGIPQKKLSRLVKIGIEATEQSSRPLPPSIHYSDTLPEITDTTYILNFGGVSTRHISEA